MDIFTTQLTRVVPVKLKPEKLKVKSLAKDAKSGALDEEHDHLDGHEFNTVTQQHAQAIYQGKEPPEEEKKEDEHRQHIAIETNTQTIPSEHPSLTREDLLKQASSNKAHLTNKPTNEIEDIEPKPDHLDIFV